MESTTAPRQSLARIWRGCPAIIVVSQGPTGVASRSDHGCSRCRVPCWMWAAERPAQRTGATLRGPRPPGSIVRGITSRPTRRVPAGATCMLSVSCLRGEQREPGMLKPLAGSSTAGQSVAAGDPIIQPRIPGSANTKRRGSWTRQPYGDTAQPYGDTALRRTARRHYGPCMRTNLTIEDLGTCWTGR